MKKSQLACAVWTWGVKTPEQMLLAAEEISAIGYTAFESVKAAIYAFNLDVDAYREALKPYGVRPVSFYYPLPQRGNESELFSTLEKELDFTSKMGVTRVCLQGTRGRPDVMNENEREYGLSQMVRFAEIARGFGITTNVHPHVGTYFMYEDEIDYVMQNSDEGLLKFAPDTAHIAAAGGDPVAIVGRYAKRVNFTHLKDYKIGDKITIGGWVNSGVPIMSCFHGLGDGCIDFPAIFRILDDAGYTGPHCMELDKAPVSNADSAKKNYDYYMKYVNEG